MSANLYASVAEFKDRLGITGNDRDFAIDRILQSSSRWIDNATSRRFYVNGTPEVRYYTADRCFWELRIDDCQSLTEVATDQNGDGVHETVWSAGTDYWLGPRNAPLGGQPYTTLNKTWWTGRYSLPSWQDSVKLTGTFGFCTIANVPANIRELCLMVAEADAGSMLDMAMPGVTTYKLGTEITVTLMGKKLPERARQILDLYQRAAFVH